MIGFHSTIDRPDSVKRVAPPTIKVRKIIAAAASSHSRTGTQLDFGRFRRLVHKCLLAGVGADHIVMGLHSQLRATKGDHVHTRAQIYRHDRPACSRVRMGPAGDGPCTISV